jgi:hypothetical protein
MVAELKLMNTLTVVQVMDIKSCMVSYGEVMVERDSGHLVKDSTLAMDSIFLWDNL